VRLLCEFKDDLDLTSKVNQVKVLCQALYYIKKFELSGKLLPSVILIADRNECFTIHTNDIFNYLGMDFDWNIAPSNAHTNIGLFTLMIEDSRINPHVFNIKDIADCVDKIKDLTDGVKRLIPITPHNVTEVFKHFEDKVIGKHKLDTNQMANLFVQLLVNPDENYLHPVTRRKTVVTKAFNEVNLKSREAFTSFFSHFSNEYSPKQRENLTAVVDRLVQDVTRRKQGEFFTPTVWVDKAHEYISSIYGEDWKDRYVVWDPAWGTGNLTRDYKFKDLYVSTLVYADIETANQMGYNPEAVKFQYDFLNDPYEYMPRGLRDSIESKKKIIVLMNPPYATSKSSKGGNKKDSKDGVAKTTVNGEMLSDGIGMSARQLYCQFLYRFIKLQEQNENINLCFFSPPSFLVSSSYEEFRSKFLQKFNFKSGFMMNSKEFADVSSWALTFSIFEASKNNDDNVKSFHYNVLSQENFTIIKESEKKIISISKSERASEWVKLKGREKVTYCNLSSSMVVKETTKTALSENYLGCFGNGCNNIEKNEDECMLLSAPYSGNIGVDISHENYNKVITLFAARKIIPDDDWRTQKDEYFIPNENHETFQEFYNNSIVISLFDTHSGQSSLRNVTYQNQYWNIKNQFFWMSKEEMANLANNNNYNELYNDARTDSDRYVHTLLFGEEGIYDQLSDEAKDVLDSATNLVRLSFGMRRNFADDTNHLNSWDAGYAQLKLLWKEYYPEQFKEFRDKYKVLEDKMRPMVYELGFLLK
jgi:hypothetical protein